MWYRWSRTKIGSNFIYVMHAGKQHVVIQSNIADDTTMFGTHLERKRATL